MEHIILKIQYLIRLSKSSNENEAANALTMAQKLCEKHSIKLEDIEEKEEKPVYDDNQLFHENPESLEWVDMLAFAVADKYDCYIIKEANLASTGETIYKYFAYGDEVDSLYVKKVFELLYQQMLSSISMKTRGRGKLYIESYSEGLVNGVKVNLAFEDFEMPGLVELKSSEIEGPALVKTETEEKAPPPIKEKENVKKDKEKPLDILAYFKGEGDGRKIHISDDIDDLADSNLMVGIDLSQLFSGKDYE